MSTGEGLTVKTLLIYPILSHTLSLEPLNDLDVGAHAGTPPLRCGRTQDNPRRTMKDQSLYSHLHRFNRVNNPNDNIDTNLKDNNKHSLAHQSESNYISFTGEFEVNKTNTIEIKLSHSPLFS